MTERLVLIPPEYKETDMPIIFLAGPISGAADWQSEAIKIIHRLNPDIAIASPRRQEWGDPSNFDYEGQVAWESHYLNEAGKSGVVVFWMPKQTEENRPGREYAQTTRMEFGERWTRYQIQGIKLVVGIEDSFTGSRYIKERLSKDTPQLTIHQTLEDVCADALSQVNQ